MPLDVQFKDKGLEELATNKEARDGRYSQSIQKVFRKRMQQIVSTVDERDFYKTTSLHFEKLKGGRSHQHSMRLNDQWRLIVELVGDAPNTQILIVGIEDYH
jgi:proteic killer suppression protein